MQFSYFQWFIIFAALLFIQHGATWTSWSAAADLPSLRIAVQNLGNFGSAVVGLLHPMKCIGWSDAAEETLMVVDCEPEGKIIKY